MKTITALIISAGLLMSGLAQAATSNQQQHHIIAPQPGTLAQFIRGAKPQAITSKSEMRGARRLLKDGLAGKKTVQVIRVDRSRTAFIPMTYRPSLNGNTAYLNMWMKPTKPTGKVHLPVFMRAAAGLGK